MRNTIEINPLFSTSTVEMVEREAAEVEKKSLEPISAPKEVVGELAPEVRGEVRDSHSGHVEGVSGKSNGVNWIMAFSVCMVLTVGISGHMFTAIQLASLIPALFFSCLIPFGLHKAESYEDALKIFSTAHFALVSAGILQVPFSGAGMFGALFYMLSMALATIIVAATAVSHRNYVDRDQTADVEDIKV